MGAWIEIRRQYYTAPHTESLPLWERGLKCIFYHLPFSFARVAPLVGAWIEIPTVTKVDVSLAVAPLVGAWIEISLPAPAENSRSAVAPLVGAWIEIPVYGRTAKIARRRSPCGSVD